MRLAQQSFFIYQSFYREDMMTDQQINDIISALENYNEGRQSPAWRDGRAAARSSIVIGLGGMGVSAMLKVKRKIYDRVDPGTAEMDSPQNIAFLGIDTDQTYRKMYEEKCGRDAANRDFIFCEMQSLEPDLTDGFSREEYSWMDPALKDFLKNNPGRIFSRDRSCVIRQIGRLALLHNKDRVRSMIACKLLAAAEALPKNGVPEIDIFILTGLSGGTGSGMLMDLPAMIRSAAVYLPENRPINIMGVFFMPDVSITYTKAAENPLLRMRLESNASAALKELDNLDDLNFSRLYDHCMLVSAMDEHGFFAMDNPQKIYDQTLERAAEMVFDFLIDEEIINGWAGPGIRTYFSASKAQHQQFIRMLKQDGTLRPVNYRYLTLGASYASFAEGPAIRTLMRQAFAPCGWNREPGMDDIMNCVRELGLDAERMEHELKRNMQTDMEHYLTLMINEAPRNAEGFFEYLYSMMNHFTERTTKIVMQKSQEIQHWFVTAAVKRQNLLYTLFTQRESGPIFAARCIDSHNAHCLLAYLHEQIALINNRVPYLQNTIERMLAKLGQMRDTYGRAALLFRRRQWIEEFRDIVRRLMIAKLDLDVVLPEMQRMMQLAIHALQEQYTAFFAPAAEMTQRILSALDYDPDMRGAAYGNAVGDEYLTEIGSPAQTTMAMNHFLASHPAERDQVMKFPETFYAFVLEHFDAWGNSPKRKAEEEIVRMAADYFTNALNLDGSIDGWTDFITEENVQACQELCRKIFRDLHAKSRIRFPVAQNAGQERIPYPELVQISISTGSPFMRSVITQEGAGINTFLKQEKSVRNQIFMMQLRMFVPLEDYALFNEMSKAYEQMKRSEEGMGLHLEMPWD